MIRQIEWMHPSWRDLVIDHLSSNSAARRKFLSRCGLQGFMLAFSSAGGASGNRVTPLLVDADDWHALTNSLPTVLASEISAPGRVLDAVRDAIAASKAMVPIGSEPRLLELAGELLKHLHADWQTTPQKCTALLLLKYYQLSECLWPLPRSPNLPAIWDAHVEATFQEIDESDPEEADTDYPAVRQWIDLADTIANNEPRFLRQAGFSEKYLETLQALIASLKTRVSYDFEFETEEACSEEETRLNHFKTMGWQLARLAPKLSETAKDVARSASTREETIREHRWELEEAAKEGQQSSNNKLVTPTPIDSGESVDIADVFRDL